MRIGLIIPPSPFLLDERVFPSLGILHVAAALEQQGQHVDVLDLSGVQNYIDMVREFVTSTNLNRFGITATTPQLPAATNISKVIKECNPSAKIAIGGAHPTSAWAAAKISDRGKRVLLDLKTSFDVAVVGDGELTLAQAWDTGAKLVIDGEQAGYPSYLSVEQLDLMPLPARHLIDLKSYHYSLDGQPATSMITQRGCPFKCGFCGGRSSPVMRGLRRLGIQRTVDEMRHLHAAYGYTGMMFFDDEVNVNSVHLLNLMQAVTELQDSLGVEFRLRGFVKSELLTAEQATAMHQAGFRWLLVGFESGSDRILKAMNKTASQSDNSRCMDIARKAGLKVKALMSVGHPGESAESIQETEDWLISQAPDDIDVTVVSVYPSSPYFDQASERQPGIWTYENEYGVLHQYAVDYTTTEDYYKGDPNGGAQSMVFTPSLPAEDIVKARDAVDIKVRAKLHIPTPTRTASSWKHDGTLKSLMRSTEGT